MSTLPTASVQVGWGWPVSKPVVSELVVADLAGWASSRWTVARPVPAGARSIVSPTEVFSLIVVPERVPLWTPSA
ncbi:hypothetical protein [Streptomyces sasae]|uniref:hypothetical protein n=1 Tax=Streptomyces sasae TaxID=1266772 RepID=UPI00292E1D45|nr:hypothetical protein [Streptomyces sasae]